MAGGGMGAGAGTIAIGRAGAVTGTASFRGEARAGGAVCGVVGAGAPLGVSKKYCSAFSSASKGYVLGFGLGGSDLGSALTTRYSCGWKSGREGGRGLVLWKEIDLTSPRPVSA